MLLGLNTLEYYESQDLQRFESSEQNLVNLTAFAINVVPCFALISDTSATSGTVQIFNADTNQAFGSTFLVVISTNSDAKQLLFVGNNNTGGSKGRYYSKITAGSDIYYSEVFEWIDSDEIANRVKIEATQGNFILNNQYTIDTLSLNYIAYFNIPVVENENELPDEIEGETNEDGVDKTFGTVVLSGTSSFFVNMPLITTQGAYKYLSTLRQSEIAGEITITFQSVIKEAFNFEIEVNNNTDYGRIIDCTLKFKEKLFLTNSNE